MNGDVVKDTRLRRRLTLRSGGRPFLERWGLCHDRVGGFYLHKIVAPDPGKDLHDHPWSFVSIVLFGGYTEERMTTRAASVVASMAELWGVVRPGVRSRRRWLSVRRTRLDVAHRIVDVKPHTWTFVLRGPTRRVWGFYPPSGRVVWTEYDYATRRPS